MSAMHYPRLFIMTALLFTFAAATTVSLSLTTPELAEPHTFTAEEPGVPLPALLAQDLA